MRSEHLDYLPLIEGGPMRGYSATRPPCNEVVSTFLLIGASLAGSYLQYDSAQTQARQTEINTEAQSKALRDSIGEEQRRQAMENEENQRRAVQEQRRFRASQLASMAGSGSLLGTGSSLALEADTWAKQQTELADQQRVNQMAQSDLAFQRRNQSSAAMQMGSAQAAGMRRDATGAAISGLASAAGQGYQAWSTRPQRAP